MRFAPFVVLIAACAQAGCQSASPAPAASTGDAPAYQAPFGGPVPASGIVPSSPGERANGLQRPVLYLGTGQFTGQGAAGDAAIPTVAENGVKLNFVNLPVTQAAKAVLGDILSLNYVIDPKVRGKITIQTSRPVDKATALALFQSALRTTRAALVESGGLYKVVPAAEAATAGSRVSVGAAANEGAIGAQIRVVQLKYVSAANMKLILDPIAPHGAVVRADSARNILVLSGDPAEISSLLDAISIFDVDTMRGMSFGLVPVRTSNPGALADSLRRLFASDKKGPMSGMLRFIPNRRLGAILVITPQPRYLADAEAWIRKLDAQAQGDTPRFFTYSVQNRPAKDLVGILRSLLTQSGSGAGASPIAPRGGRAAVVATPAAGSTTSNAGLGTLAGARFRGAAAGSSSAGSSGFSARGKSPVTITADDAENTLIVRATPKQYRGILRLIRRLDVMPNQVLIEATIAEVSLNDELKFGVRWFFRDHASSTTFTDDAGGALSSLFPGFSYALQASSAQATLNALAQVTHVSVLSSPSLMVLDNKKATLQVGDQVPITTQSAVSVMTTGAPVINSVSYRNTGVILSITPRINESGRVLLKIEQEVSSVAPTTSSNIDSPTIQQRKIQTTVVLNDGQSLTLGGLIQKKRSVAKDQVPILGDLPVVGAAFRSKDDAASRTELIIIITPRVVRNLGEAQAVTDDYRRAIAIYDPRMPRRDIGETVRRIFK